MKNQKKYLLVLMALILATNLFYSCTSEQSTTSNNSTASDEVIELPGTNPEDQSADVG